MAMLEPKLAILDETDSGLDIDALRMLPWVNKLKATKRHHSYYALPKIMDHIVPDFVHVL
jgi:Fe-S cluster assembly ATPase SufC